MGQGFFLFGCFVVGFLGVMWGGFFVWFFCVWGGFVCLVLGFLWGFLVVVCLLGFFKGPFQDLLTALNWIAPSSDFGSAHPAVRFLKYLQKTLALES